jgi:phage terminase large subunit GpA-like protein
MDLERAIRHSPELAAAMSPRARDDNTFDKFFRNGMTLKLGWPAISQLSAKTLKYIFLTDYDRPEDRDNVGGEGPMWDLAFKRSETYMSRGKCLAESSPGEDQVEPKWSPRSPHEAPPARGILSLYNRGTRARWYWPCLHCHEHMQATPGVEIFGLPPLEELLEEIRGRDLLTLAEDFARIVCKKCGGILRMDNRTAMQQRGRWVHEGQTIDARGRVIGEPQRTNIASYWLGGAAAAYQRWDAMLLGYLQAVDEYARTGDENSMRTKVNTDFAAPYLPVHAMGARKASDLKERVEKDLVRGVVPLGVRFLTAAVDVQKQRFVVTIFGWGPGLECWILDRFTLNQSATRRDGQRPAPLDPAVYAEDWKVLVKEAVLRRLPLVENTDLTMPVRMTLVDSGGEDGVTLRAYEFWRAARELGLGERVMLVKGANRKDAPRVEMTWPDASQRKDRHAGAMGDVPVWRLNTTTFKDAIVGDLARVERGAGFVHLPAWAEDSMFDEYVAEERGPKGWERVAARNEALDLHVYNRAACTIVGAEQIDWANPPDWAVRASAAMAELEKAKKTGAISEREFEEKRQEVQSGAAEAGSGSIEWRKGKYLR